MTARKTMTKTAVTTEEVETNVTTTSLASMPDTGRPYVRESGEFDAMVYSYRKTAQREIDELDMEIARLQTEVEARMARKQDLMMIVYKAEAVLSMKTVSPTQTPQLTERSDA